MLKRNGQGKPRLSSEIFEMIGQVLANAGCVEGLRNSDAMKALASLNRTCRAIHQITLPILYEKTVYLSEETFGRSLTSKLPDGWVHTQ